MSVSQSQLQPGVQPASAKGRGRGYGCQFKPGQSGCPDGGWPIKTARNARQQARLVELRQAIASEFPGEQTTLEAVLIDQAGDGKRCILVRLALQLMSQIRQGRKEREAAKPVLNALDQYLAQKAAAR